MLVLGIESSCDETGVALYDTERGLLAHHLHTQMAMHAEYGGVVPELASRDHIRRVVPLTQGCLKEAGVGYADIDAVAFTQGPGLGGALLTGSGFANALAFAIGKPVIPVHHLEGHLLSPLLADDKPEFPFVALLVSGGHTQFMAVRGIGDYTLLGESVDDAAGEAFDKTAKLLGLPYPGGAKLSELAKLGTPDAFTFPRPHAPFARFADELFRFENCRFDCCRKSPCRKQATMKFPSRCATTFAALSKMRWLTYWRPSQKSVVGYRLQNFGGCRRCGCKLETA